MTTPDHAAKQQTSWIANATAWTEAVREGRIASRRNGTDAAILEACQVKPGVRALDVGCGEGWLSRALASSGAEVIGIDASAPLIHAARAAGAATYEVVDYEGLSKRADVVPGPFDLIVLNFALLDEEIRPLLRGLAARLSDEGRLVIQTVHPFVAAGAEGYVDGWREERFVAFGEGFSAPMPWFFRTFATWYDVLMASDLSLVRLHEPRAPDESVLSLLLECRREPG
jgi:2-polyprenyl-3-methyl-5-hydroxy-6-metoxy-1,4-benzoquinol methylase